MIITDASLVTSSPGQLTVTLTPDSVDGYDVGRGISVTLFYHDDVAVDWFSNGGCTFDGSKWHVSFAVDVSTTRRLLELRAVLDADRNEIEIQCERLFLEPENGGEWTRGKDAEDERESLGAARRARYEQPIIGDGCTTDDPQYSVVMLADNLRLTKPQRVAGIEVVPLSTPLFGGEMLSVLNYALGQAGFVAAGIDLGKLEAHLHYHRPAVIVHAPVVHAKAAKNALAECQRHIQTLLDLMSFRRHATPRLLAGVAGLRQPDGSVAGEVMWIEGMYTGNVLGGFLSGEDQSSLLTQWTALRNDSRLQLWLALCADAIADKRWDYRFFRCFNLLEGIGKELLPPALVIRDSAGNALLKADGKPYTTGQARGKVYELVRRAAAATNSAEESFATLRSDGTRGPLWDDVGVWVAVRNAVAHTGSWELPAGVTPDNKHVAAEQAIMQRSFDGTFANGADGVTRSIREAVKNTLNAIIRNLL